MCLYPYFRITTSVAAQGLQTPFGNAFISLFDEALEMTTICQQLWKVVMGVDIFERG